MNVALVPFACAKRICNTITLHEDQFVPCSPLLQIDLKPQTGLALRTSYQVAHAWARTLNLSDPGTSVPAAVPPLPAQSCVWVQEVKILTAMWIPARVAAAEASCAQLSGAVIGTQGCENEIACTIVPAIDGTKYNESDLQQLIAGEIVAPHPRLSRFKHPQMSSVRKGTSQYIIIHVLSASLISKALYMCCLLQGWSLDPWQYQCASQL